MNKEYILDSIALIIEELPLIDITEAIVKEEITIEEIVTCFRNELLLGIDL